MTSISSLFSLVHSLTKPEKRYFRLSVSLQRGEKEYVKLFDLLELHQNFGSALKKDLNGLFPGSSVEPARKHLYRVLMKSLRNIQMEKQVEVRLMNLVQDSTILFNKGLVNESFQQLHKAKSMALKYEKFTFFILAAQNEIKHLIQLQFIGVDENTLIKKQEEINKLQGQLSTIHQHASLYELLLIRFWKSGTVRSLRESTQLNDLLLEEHMILNSQQSQSFESQQLHLQFQSVYFLMTGDPEGSLKVSYDLDKLFQQNAHLWADNPLYYVHFLNGILHNLRRMQHYEEMTFFLQRLNATAGISGSFALSIEYQVFEHELHRAVNQAQQAQALALIQQRSPLLDKEIDQLPIHIHAQLCLTIARAWYSAGAYSTALKYINRALSQPSNSLNRLLYVSCRLMNLLIHLALENTDYLHYEIRSSERKLKAEHSWYKVEQLVFHQIKQWLRNRSVNVTPEQLLPLLEDPFEKQLILELGLEEWVLSIQPIKSPA